MVELDKLPVGALQVVHGTLLAHRALGVWEPVEPLRRRAKDMAALNRDYAGRFVWAHDREQDVCVFVNRFVDGVLVHDQGEWPVGPDTVIAVDPHGRRLYLERLVADAREAGRREVIDQLRRRAAQLAKFAAGADVSAGTVERARAQQEALEMEADYAAGLIPPVTPTNLGVTATDS